jgi:hypothetical protein
MINEKTSLQVLSQLPEFVRDNPDYENFKLFIQAYYEWMEQNNQVTERSKNLLNYKDIDNTSSEFIDYYKNEFLPYFPKDILVDEKKAIKFARELYQSKGTPASYKFLFRILFNSDVDIFYTKDAVLKASDGIWYVPKSVKLATDDVRFLSIANYRLFGKDTKSIATIETSQLAGGKIEVFISNIERLFSSGETVTVVDNNNQPVLIDDEPLVSKIVGQISNIKISSKAPERGQLYRKGDPVIVYDGLSSNSGIGATASVGDITSGAITSIIVTNGGYGYTTTNPNNESPNTEVKITYGGEASANVATVDTDVQKQANVAFLPTDSIAFKKDLYIGNTTQSFGANVSFETDINNIHYGNPNWTGQNYGFANNLTANANTTLANAFTFTEFTTYPLSSILVTNGGGGITRTPVVEVISEYLQETEDRGYLKTMGILAPIQIVANGAGYAVNDRIVFSGGSGLGAYANVTSVSGSGQILNVEYVKEPGATTIRYPTGGMGYTAKGLPTVTVSSVSGHDAQLVVPGILGDGAQFIVGTDRVGSITTINVLNHGEDYVEKPKVSLKVHDVLIKGLTALHLPQKGDFIYQGTNLETASYRARFDSYKLLRKDNDPLESIYYVRLFNYNAKPNPSLPLKIDPYISLTMINYALDLSYDDNGIKTYGNGAAKANASFLNGLVIGSGEYLNSQGQPSSFSVLQDEVYNNFTYQITVEKEIEKYRDTLLNLLHPTGMKVLGRMSMRNTVNYNTTANLGLGQGHTLGYYIPTDGGFDPINSYVTMVTDFTNKGNNILEFHNLNSANIAEFITTGSSISITTENVPYIRSDVTTVDYANNRVILDDSTWLTFSNVATVYGGTGNTYINIGTLTGSFDLINGGVYSNTDYPLKDIVVAGDTIKFTDGTTKVVSSVQYTVANGIIHLTSALSSDVNSLMSVRRNFSANSDIVLIYGPDGL